MQKRYFFKNIYFFYSPVHRRRPSGLRCHHCPGSGIRRRRSRSRGRLFFTNLWELYCRSIFNNIYSQSLTPWPGSRCSSSGRPSRPSRSRTAIRGGNIPCIFFLESRQTLYNLNLYIWRNTTCVLVRPQARPGAIAAKICNKQRFQDSFYSKPLRIAVKLQ